MRALVAFASLLALCTPRDGYAVDVRFCFDYDVEYLDNDGTVTTDFLNDNTTDVPARGINYKIFRNGGALTPEFAGWAEESGAYRGCTPSLPLNPQFTYDIYALSKASVNGNELRVYNQMQGTVLSAFVEHDYIPPVAATTVDLLLPPAEWTNVLAAASWAIHYHNGGVTGKLYQYYSPHDGTVCTDCVDNPTGIIHLAESDQRGTIIHETGHLLAIFADEGMFPNLNYNAPFDGCGIPTASHDQTTKEFQSAAVHEGFANFYAAISLNDTSDPAGDCWLHPGYAWTGNMWEQAGVDWNNNGSITVVGEEDTIDCSGDPNSAANAPDDWDWLGDAIATPLGACGGVSVNRGVEYDWTRFWWDMMSTEGLSFQECVEILDGANPKSWAPDDNWMIIWGNDSENPSSRLRSASYLPARQVEYANQETLNGVHR